MERNFLDNYKNLKVFKKIFFSFGIIFLVVGICLIFLSFCNEVLDNKYIVRDVSSFTSSAKSLETGEMSATKDTKYVKNGRFEITYTNYSKGKNDLVDTGTYFNITDMIGNGFVLDDSEVIINDDSYKFSNGNCSSKDGIKIDYQNNVLDIEIPDTLINKKNKIVIYIKLVGRDEKVKYVTSQDAYFSFVPSLDNDYYGKKSSQAYVIEGYGYIRLAKK